jgi:dolichol-phosphate mannosyltransferase
VSDSIVIIPTYKERENVQAIIEAVFAQPKPFDVLIVDDNSPDGTAEIVEGLQKSFNTDSSQRLHLLKRSGKQGLGTAYIAGFRYAIANGYEYVLEMDADFSHDPKDLVQLYKACANGADLSIGSRYATGVNVVNWPMGRVLLSYFASWYVRLITTMPIADTTAGFVCYRKKVLETIPLHEIKFVGYAFQIEMKFLAWKYGFNLQEVPIVFTERVRGESKMSAGIFKEAFFGVLQMTITSWFKKYIPANG